MARGCHFGCASQRSTVFDGCAIAASVGGNIEEGGASASWDRCALVVFQNKTGLAFSARRTIFRGTSQSTSSTVMDGCAVAASVGGNIEEGGTSASWDFDADAVVLHIASFTFRASGFGSSFTGQ